MSCEACKEAYKIDEIEPDCFEGECKIPPLTARGRRIMEMRSLLIRLRDVVDAGTILKEYHADLDDMELLAVVEDETKKNQKNKEDS